MSDREQQDRSDVEIGDASQKHTAPDQAELIHNEKLKALGVMSAGLAHEINNPLNYAMLGIELLKSEGREMLAPEYARTVGDIEDGLLRIRNIIQDLKIYSRKSSTTQHPREPFLIGDVVAAATRILSPKLEGIELNTVLNTPYRVIGDASGIIQVLINLIANSAESIKAKWPDSWRENDGKIDILGSIVDQRYEIQIVDNGEGIASARLDDVFTPFYTTKTSVSGTGIGMSICQAIVKRHDSRIVAESSLDAWTSMSFSLEIENQPEDGA